MYLCVMPALASEHSDFAWLKSRTESLPFDLSAGQPEMANADGHGVLNAETSQPCERTEHDLPPKSYAEAILQPFEGQQEANKHAVETNGHSSTNSTTAGNINGVRPAKGAEKELDAGKFLYADHVDRKGTAVASVKPEPGFEVALKHNQVSAPRRRTKETALAKRSSPEKPKLASGRRAGAGWERSAYVSLPCWMMRC